jgi:hypothetical protein
MIYSIILKIILNWILMGIFLAGIMAACLYFAIMCEKIVDLIFKN